MARGFRVNRNSTATRSLKSVTKVQGDLETNIERLSTGKRINSAKDDTAGFAMISRMTNQIRGLSRAKQNSEQAMSLMRVAETGLNNVQEAVHRMRELAIQAASDNLNDSDRNAIDVEYQHLKTEVTRIANSTEFNRMNLLDGSFQGNKIDMDHANTTISASVGVVDVDLTSVPAGTYTFTDVAADGQLTLGNGTDSQTMSFTPPASGGTVTIDFAELGITIKLDDQFADGGLDALGFEVGRTPGATMQIGPQINAESMLQFSIINATAEGLGLFSTSLQSVETSQNAVSALDKATNIIVADRGNLGSLQNRVEFAISNITSSVSNLEETQSAIRDTDFAAESVELAKNQILIQSSMAMLAQANQISQNVLSLLQG